MITKTDSPAASWHSTQQLAAQQAHKLRPVAQVLLGLSILMLIYKYFPGPVWAELRSAPTPNVWEAVQQYLLTVIPAGTAISLVMALSATERYLAALEKQAVWSTSTLNLIREVGDCLMASALFSILIVPTVELWTSNRWGFDWHLDVFSLALLSLGLLLDLMARVFNGVLRSAEHLKADHDAIV